MKVAKINTHVYINIYHNSRAVSYMMYDSGLNVLKVGLINWFESYTDKQSNGGHDEVFKRQLLLLKDRYKNKYNERLNQLYSTKKLFPIYNLSIEYIRLEQKKLFIKNPVLWD